MNLTHNPESYAHWTGSGKVCRGLGKCYYGRSNRSRDFRHGFATEFHRQDDRRHRWHAFVLLGKGDEAVIRTLCDA